MKKTLCILVGLALAAGMAQAANKDWDAGGDGSNWSSANNWDPNTTLNDSTAYLADVFRFIAAGGGTVNNDLTGSTFSRINIGGGAWTIDGNAITLDYNGTTQSRIFFNAGSDANYNLDTAIAGGPLLIETRAATADLYIGGNLSGANGLDVQNVNGGTDAQVVLTGNNTFSGDITIVTGNGAQLTTLVGDTDAFNNNDMIVGSGGNQAQVIFNQTTDGTYSGAFTGNGAFIKQGAGKLTLTANAVSGTAFAGRDATIENGTVQLEAINALGNGDVILGASSGSDDATLAFGGTLANAVNFDQNIVVASGSSGAKTISTVSSGTANINLTGTLTLNDNVTIDNVNQRTTDIQGAISGSSRIEINAGNQQAWRTQISGANTSFSGDTWINRGRVQAANDDAFGSGTVRLGGAASTYFTVLGINNDVTIDNDIIVAGGGTRRLINAAYGTDADGITVNSDIQLNTDLQLEAEGVASGGDAITLAGIVSGNGGLTIREGVDSVGLSGLNTYAGDTTIETGATLNFNDAAGLTYYIGANGVNNQINGDGTVNLLGDFTFDLTGADETDGNIWTIVDVTTLTETFDADFSVNGFNEITDVWTMVDGDNTWTFSESTGVLGVSVIPEPATVGMLGLGGLLVAIFRRRLMY